MVARQGPCFIVVSLQVQRSPADTAEAQPRAGVQTPPRPPWNGNPRVWGLGRHRVGWRAGSVELDGAAVVLTVLALLLRGAHEAAQKVPWKQTQAP